MCLCPGNIEYFVLRKVTVSTSSGLWWVLAYSFWIQCAWHCVQLFYAVLPSAFVELIDCILLLKLLIFVLKQTKSHLSYCLLFRVLLIFFFFLLLSCGLFFTVIGHLIKPIVKKHSAILENNDRESKRFSRGNWLGFTRNFRSFQ